MTSKCLLLAGGLGTRLRPLTDTVPKCLVPIGERLMLDYWVEALAAAGIRDTLINTHHLAEQVDAYAAKVNQLGGTRLTTVLEPELLGSAGTIHANRDWADDADCILVVYADNLSNVSLADFLAFHQAHRDPFSMLLFEAPNPQACGIAELDSDQRIVSFIEKPKLPKSNLANAGVYMVDADAYREIADMRGFDIGFDVLPRFAGRMRGMIHSGYHRDIGTLQSLEQARHDVAQGLVGL